MEYAVALLMFGRRNHCHVPISRIVAIDFALSALAVSIEHIERHSCLHDGFKNFRLKTIGSDHDRFNLLAYYSRADLEGRMHEVDQRYIMVFLLRRSFIIDDGVQINLVGILSSLGLVLHGSNAFALRFRLLCSLLCFGLEAAGHALEVELLELVVLVLVFVFFHI